MKKNNVIYIVLMLVLFGIINVEVKAVTPVAPSTSRASTLTPPASYHAGLYYKNAPFSGSGGAFFLDKSGNNVFCLNKDRDVEPYCNSQYTYTNKVIEGEGAACAIELAILNDYLSLPTDVPSDDNWYIYYYRNFGGTLLNYSGDSSYKMYSPTNSSNARTISDYIQKAIWCKQGKTSYCVSGQTINSSCSEFRKDNYIITPIILEYSSSCSPQPQGIIGIKIKKISNKPRQNIRLIDESGNSIVSEISFNSDGWFALYKGLDCNEENRTSKWTAINAEGYVTYKTLDPNQDYSIKQLATVDGYNINNTCYPISGRSTGDATTEIRNYTSSPRQRVYLKTSDNKPIASSIVSFAIYPGNSCSGTFFYTLTSTDGRSIDGEGYTVYKVLSRNTEYRIKQITPADGYIMDAGCYSIPARSKGNDTTVITNYYANLSITNKDQTGATIKNNSTSVFRLYRGLGCDENSDHWDRTGTNSSGNTTPWTIKTNDDYSIKQIAELLKSTEGSVYTTIAKMRAKKIPVPDQRMKKRR